MHDPVLISCLGLFRRLGCDSSLANQDDRYVWQFLLYIIIEYHTRKILSSETLCFRREFNKPGYILGGPQMYIIDISY